MMSIKDKKLKYRNLTSEGAILRDYISPPYLDTEHKMLVDIADCLYNANISPDYLTEDTKRYYKRYGEDFWHAVLNDMEALDSQMADSKVGELLLEYHHLLEVNG